MAFGLRLELDEGSMRWDFNGYYPLDGGTSVCYPYPMKPAERKIVFDLPKMALVSMMSCPDCGSYVIVPFLAHTLRGKLVCVNPSCLSSCPVELRPDSSQKRVVEKMRQTARQILAESRAIDWSTADVAI